MFDKQSIEAYRNIKAPEELREKVMRLNPELSSPGSNHRSKNAMLRPIAAVACAAVFCLAVSFSFWNQKDAALLYQGIPVEGEPAVIAADMPQSAALVRDSVPSGIPLELETAERTKVSVSGGELSAVSYTHLREERNFDNPEYPSERTGSGSEFRCFLPRR